MLIQIYGPNLVGFFLASIQMVLFAVYGIQETSRSDSNNDYSKLNHSTEVEPSSSEAITIGEYGSTNGATY